MIEEGREKLSKIITIFEVLLIYHSAMMCFLQYHCTYHNVCIQYEWRPLKTFNNLLNIVKFTLSYKPLNLKHLSKRVTFLG